MKPQQPNEWGVYDSADCECINVPLAKKLNSHLTIYVVLGSDGLWRAATHRKFGEGGCSSLPSQKGPTFATRTQAIASATSEFTAAVEQVGTGLTVVQVQKILESITEFSQLFPVLDNDGTGTAITSTQEAPAQPQKTRAQKTAVICGWMSTELPNRPSSPLYVYKYRNDWGVTADHAQASRFKNVESVLEWYRANGSVHGDPEANIYNGFLQIFTDGPSGLQQLPRPTKQASIFDELAALPQIERQPDLIRSATTGVDNFSTDENKVLAAGFVLARYNRVVPANHPF